MSSGRLILPLAEPALLATGEPDTGAVLSVFIAGGSTPASLYADAGLTTPITNPQVSDSAGRFYRAILAHLGRQFPSLRRHDGGVGRRDIFVG